MGRKIQTFSKPVLSIFIAIFALTFFSLSGSGGFLKSSMVEAAEPAAGLIKDNPGIRNAIEVQKRHKTQLMSIPGVVGVGIGIGASGKPVIRVFTRRAGIPRIPEHLDNVPVHIKVTGEFLALSDPTARFNRPVPIGVSTGHPDITAGTLGARVKDSSGNVYALSNNHVYANSNNAALGDNALQPGPYDGGIEPDDKIGVLCAFEPIDFEVFGSNTIDAAIVCITPDEVGNSTLPEGYGTPNSIIFNDLNLDGNFDNLDALLLQPVQKFGRTTGLTHGQVTEINVTSMICYANCNSIWAEYAWFDDQISITSVNSDAFSLGGDSGSLIVTDDDNKNSVGLLFAGSSTVTLANRIDLVLNHFNVSIDDSQPTIPAIEDCNNGYDDDGDGTTDCDDSDCIEDPVCQNAEIEICDDGLDNDNDGDSDCYDMDCEAECAALYCFKGTLDGNCNPKKDGQFCPDCLGASQPVNEVCTGGVDEDLDDLIDCNDPDCFDDPTCVNGDCLSKGSICTSDDECCSGICRGVKCK